jgi:hypothetical protein
MFIRDWQTSTVTLFGKGEHKNPMKKIRLDNTEKIMELISGR